MNKMLTFCTVTLFCLPGFAASSNPRATNAAQWTGVSRSGVIGSKTQPSKSSPTNTNTITTTVADSNYEEEKNACINNNMGISNTFVWASKYSDSSDYTNMIEDMDKTENNVCFVKVKLSSTDSDINVDDIESMYYILNNEISCGDWVDDEMLQKRILKAKKSKRTWGTIAGGVGGAGVGVGSMELFGNKAIGGKVQGQEWLKSTDQTAWVRSELLELKQSNIDQYNSLISNLKILKQECDNLKTVVAETEMPSECTSLKYDELLSSLPN